MTPIAEVRLPIVIGGRGRTLIFNLNTMAAYEEATEILASKSLSGKYKPKFYWDTMLELLKFYEEHEKEISELGRAAKEDSPEKVSRRARLGTKIMRYISARDIQALLWAALHEYNRGEDEPVWSITLEQVGKYIAPSASLGVIAMIVKGHQANSPTRDELGEASGPPSSKKIQTIEEGPAARTEESSGGTPFTESLAAAYD